ncbi:protein of unknown function [Paraburkholderia kururiensis]
MGAMQRRGGERCDTAANEDGEAGLRSGSAKRAGEAGRQSGPEKRREEREPRNRGGNSNVTAATRYTALSRFSPSAQSRPS